MRRRFRRRFHPNHRQLRGSPLSFRAQTVQVLRQTRLHRALFERQWNPDVHRHRYNVGPRIRRQSINDPEVDAFYSIKNTMGTTRTIASHSSCPRGARSRATLTSGSLSGELTNTTGGTATLATYGGLPIMQTYIDGNAWQPLLSSPQAFTAVGAGTTVNVPANAQVSFGDLITTVAYPNPITTSIEIVLNFSLTPGALAGFTGSFVVVPEPSSIALMAMGIAAVGLAAWRRRGGKSTS